jgi:tRNA pseudouridine38-40 synthase
MSDNDGEGRNIRLVLAYDGTDFCGWQLQKTDRTVQGVVEEALGKIHNRPVRVAASGRTDSGVHANGQVINFLSDMETIPAEKFLPTLNSLLPRDVRVLKSDCAQPDFHSRYDARLRIYKYYLSTAATEYPSNGRYCHRVNKRHSIDRLNEYARTLLGEKDFTSFAAASDPTENKVRTISCAAFYPEGGCQVFKIAATAFLRHMVRSIVGTILDLADHGEDPNHMRRILEGRDRTLAGTTAPACGLFLDRVIYKGEEMTHAI